MTVAGFSRENFEDKQSLNYHIASLGFVRNGDLLGRALAAPLHWWRALRAGRQLQDCDTIWVSSLDMLLLGIMLRPFLKGRQRLVYDVIDLTPSQVSPGARGRLLRAAERIACKQVDALVLSSPWFWWGYYAALAPHLFVLLLENKVSAPAPEIAPSPPAPPWRIVWHGQLRCRTSLNIILDLARALPETVEVHAWGAVLDHLRPDFAEADATVANFIHHGPYSDADIAPVFAGAHFIFGYDVDNGRNSELLLPYRLYHGAARALPVLGIAGTVVGRVVETQKLGRAFDAADAKPLISFFETLTMQQYEALRDAITPERRKAAVYADEFRQLVVDIENNARERALPANEQIEVVLAPSPSAQLAAPLRTA